MAELITSESLNEKEILIFRNYGVVNEAKKDFYKKAKLSTFFYLFGQEDGSRLWTHFVIDCKRFYDKFETYLTREQHNTLLMNVTLNQELYIQ